jgi:uncharacterized protein DUF5955
MSHQRDGIRIGNVQGGITGSNIGHGSNNTNTVGAAPSQRVAEIEQRVRELDRLINEYAHHIEDPESARAALDSMKEELRSGSPRPPRLRMFLNAVTGAAAGVSAITSAAAGIKDLLNGLLPT